MDPVISQNSLHSSSSAPHSNPDVFLSFRGEETPKIFTDHLYTALIRSGIRTFMDNHELPVGHNLPLALRKPIRESRVSIVVFSAGNASSEWCLDELVKIVECKENWGYLIVPVSYNVDPSDVREQTGPFADDFARYEECFVGEIAEVERWRFAMREATKLSGWKLQNVANGVHKQLKVYLRPIKANEFEYQSISKDA